MQGFGYSEGRGEELAPAHHRGSAYRPFFRVVRGGATSLSNTERSIDQGTEPVNTLTSKIDRRAGEEPQVDD